MIKWPDFIKKQFKGMIELEEFLTTERKTKIIYPRSEHVLNAYKLTDYDKVRCVILGREPYCTPFSAHGLAFSSLQTDRPPALQVIFKEIKDDVFPNSEGIDCFKSNNLTEWTEQGVMLLNIVHTVEACKPRSHAGKGWEELTANTLEALNLHPKRLVFILWGEDAISYKKHIKDPKHLILEAINPKGCKHFSKANEFLEQFNPRGNAIGINFGIWNSTY